jgi:hypothetical protein
MLLINNVMKNITSTTLYVKQHNKTGLKYFGKTIQRDPEKYKGSGLYWEEHLKIHGNDISTVWTKTFDDKQQLTEFAIKFSEENNIVNSDEWANLKPENGLDGATPGHTYGKANKGKKLGPLSDSHRANVSAGLKGNTNAKGLAGYTQSQDHVDKRMKAHRGVKKGPQTAEHIASRFEKKQCIYCKAYFSPTNFSRWHGENCKNK